MGRRGARGCVGADGGGRMRGGGGCAWCLGGSDRELQKLCSVRCVAPLSMYLVGRFFLVSGAALESVMQHRAPEQKFMLPSVKFHDFF